MLSRYINERVTELKRYHKPTRLDKEMLLDLYQERDEDVSKQDGDGGDQPLQDAKPQNVVVGESVNENDGQKNIAKAVSNEKLGSI